MALLEQQQPLMSKHVGRLGALARGARRKDELVAEERLRLDLETLDGKRNENQVEIAADQRSNKSLGDRLAEVQSEIRGAVAARAVPPTRDRARSTEWPQA